MAYNGSAIFCKHFSPRWHHTHKTTRRMVASGLQDSAQRSPIGSAIQISADKLMMLIEDEKNATISVERDRFNKLEQEYEVYRTQQQHISSLNADENHRLTHQIAQLTRQLTLANEGAAQNPSSTAIDARVADLEAENESLRREREQLITSSATEVATFMNQVGIYHVRPSVLSFGNGWSELFAEVGLDSARTWGPGEVDSCLQHAVHVLRQRRQSAAHPSSLSTH